MTAWLSVRADIVYAVRRLRRAPGVTLTVLVVLGAAIGLNATLATVIAGVVWRPWSGVYAPDELVRIYAQDPSGQVSGLSVADARNLIGRAKTLSGVGLMRGDAVEIEARGERRSARALMISGNMLDLLGVPLALGRRITPDDDRPGAPRAVAMLAYTTWQRRFGSDRGIIGSSLPINGQPFMVVGVVSAAFESAEPAYDIDIYLPAEAVTLLRPGDLEARRILNEPRACCADVVARLRPGVTRRQATSELAVLARGWTAVSGLPARSAAVADTRFISQPGRFDSAQALVTLTMLAGGLVLVWLIACANIGNLLLARALARLREVGTRAALGASRARLVRLMVIEGAVLGVLSAVAGVLIAAQLPLALFRLVADPSTRAQFPFSVAPDATILAFAVGGGLLSALVFSLGPALIVARLAVTKTMRPGVDGWPYRFRLRSFLLAVQVAVSVILLASAGLLVRGAQQGGASFDPGFRVEGVTAVNFAVPERTYDRARAMPLFEQILADAQKQRQVDYAFASRDPFSLYREGTLVRMAGEPGDRLHEVLYLDVSSNYLSVLEIPLRAGRGFNDGDTGQPLVIVNDAMARAFWPDRDPIGQTFVMRRRGPAGEMVPQQVIGVARNVSVNASANVRPIFYRVVKPGAEVLDYIGRDPRASQAPVLLVKGPRSAAARVASLTASVDSRIRVTLTPLSDELANVRASMKWGPILASTLGVFALGLATVGMFGVFAYAVQQRAREIGVRMALGASPSAVVRFVVAGHSRAVLVGVAVGLAGAIASSIGLGARLFGLSPLDPLTYASVALLLAGAGLIAAYTPARRATRISPSAALRSE